MNDQWIQLREQVILILRKNVAHKEPVFNYHAFNQYSLGDPGFPSHLFHEAILG